MAPEIALPLLQPIKRPLIHVKNAFDFRVKRYSVLVIGHSALKIIAMRGCLITNDAWCAMNTKNKKFKAVF